MKKLVVTFSIISLMVAGCQYFSSDKGKKASGSAQNDSTMVQKKHFNNDLQSPVEWKIALKLDPSGKYVRHGICIRYTKSGKVAAKIPYVMGRKEGVSLTYHSTGKVYKEQPYINGRLSGICKRYDRQGKITAEYPFKKGLRGIGLIEYTNLGKERPTPSLSIQKVDQIKSSGKYKLVLSLTGTGSERIKKVNYYEGKLIEDNYLHDNLSPVKNTSLKKGEYVIDLPNGAVFNKTINIIAEATTTTGMVLILQKPVKLSVRGV